MIMRGQRQVMFRRFRLAHKHVVKVKDQRRRWVSGNPLRVNDHWLRFVGIRAGGPM